MNTLQKVVQHIYVISNPSSIRRDSILRTLDAFSCSYEFVFDHFAESIESSLKEFNIAIDPMCEMLSDNFYRKNASLLLNHYSCYKKFLSTDLSSVLILEDDAIIEDLTLINAALPPTWDAITIGRGLYKNDYFQARNFILQRRTNCTEAIIVSRNFAQKFIEFTDENIFDYQVDFQMNLFLDCHRQMKFFQAWPFIIEQNSILSGVSEIR